MSRPFNIKYLVIYLICYGLLVAQKQELGGCSISGKSNVCCKNEGKGPNCAYCSLDCLDGTKKEQCSLDKCGELISCKQTLTAKNEESDGYVQKIEVQKATLHTTQYTGNDFFDNSQQQSCPIFGCQFESTLSSDVGVDLYAKYGLRFESNDADARIQLNSASCTACPYTDQQFKVKCYTHLSDSAGVLSSII